MKVPRLDLRNVSFAVNGKKILNTVSWVVGPDEHWAILGPNGAGKTTLLRIVCGHTWPNAEEKSIGTGERTLILLICGGASAGSLPPSLMRSQSMKQSWMLSSRVSMPR